MDTTLTPVGLRNFFSCWLLMFYLHHRSTIDEEFCCWDEVKLPAVLWYFSTMDVLIVVVLIAV